MQCITGYGILGLENSIPNFELDSCWKINLSMCSAGKLSTLSIELGRNVISCESDEGYSGMNMKELLDLKAMKEEDWTQ